MGALGAALGCGVVVVGVGAGFAPTPLVIGSVAMVVPAFIAAVVPALRASRVAPMEALRNE